MKLFRRKIFFARIATADERLRGYIRGAEGLAGSGTANFLFPTVLGTLDAIHLSTLLLTRVQTGLNLILLTHDLQLARAGVAFGVVVNPDPDS